MTVYPGARDAVPGTGELQCELPGIHHARLPVPDRLHGHVRHGLQDQGKATSCPQGLLWPQLSP